MSPCREWQQHPRSRQKFIKKGRLHSKNALLKRQQEWMKNWKSIIEYSSRVLDEITSTNDVNCEPFSLSEHSYSLLTSNAAVKGFSVDSCLESVNMFYMLQEQINYLCQEEDLSTDEDDEIEDHVQKDKDPIEISMKISAEQMKEYGYCEETADSLEELERNAVETLTSLPNVPFSEDKQADDIATDDVDSEMGPCRPISRISLRMPYDEDDYDELTKSGYESDVLNRPASRISRCGYTSYYETDFEADESNSGGITKFPKKHPVQYGQIPGVSVGAKWKFRRGCARQSVHRPHNAGIHGGPEGAYSMVLSAEYAVDDRGEEFIYYGEGGRDPRNKKLVQDQEMARGNLALMHNLQTGNPVRVVRGFQLQNEFSPKSGYRYDGLYEVTQYSEDQMGDGFKVYMFNFVRSAHQPPPPWRINNVELPWPSGEVHPISASEDEHFESVRLLKHKRRKKCSTLASDMSRCLTPISVMSSDDGGPPPELELPETDPERPIVYPTPPYLSPGFCINPTIIEVQRRPVVILERLDKDIVSKIMANPYGRIDVSIVEQVSSQETENQNGGGQFESVCNKEVIPKKRGRKKKKKLFYKKEVVDCTTVVHDKPKKKRGRKKKEDKGTGSNNMNKLILEVHNDPSVEPPVKRKRGRPRKICHPGRGRPRKICHPGRGRPRKIYLPGNLDVTTDKQLSDIRKFVGRGRRKKSTELSNVLVPVSVSMKNADFAFTSDREPKIIPKTIAKRMNESGSKRLLSNKDNCTEGKGITAVKKRGRKPARV